MDKAEWKNEILNYRDITLGMGLNLRYSRSNWHNIFGCTAVMWTNVSRTENMSISTVNSSSLSASHFVMHYCSVSLTCEGFKNLHLEVRTLFISNTLTSTH